MPRERFEVDAEVDVYAQDGSTIVGRVGPGLHEGERLDEHWLLVDSGDGEVRYVRARDVRVVVHAAPAPDRAVGRPPDVPRPQLPPSGPAPAPTAVIPPASAPRLQRRSLFFGSIAVVAALVVGLVVVAGLGEEDAAPDVEVVVPERPLAIDLGNVLNGSGLAPVVVTSFFGELVCEPRVALPDVAVYQGQFGVSEFFVWTDGGTVTCNTLSIEVTDGEIVGLDGRFDVEDFGSELEVDEARIVRGVRCRSDVLNVFELGEVTRTEVGDGATTADASVAVAVQQTLGEPETPDVSCSERLGRKGTRTWSASVVYDDFTAIVSFTDEFGDEIGSVLLARRS